MKQKQRGDTLVEVLIAITVLAIIVTGALAIMNRSLIGIMNSSERTAVRAEINSQTELLNFARARDSATWEKIKKVAFKPTDIGLASAQCQINEGGRDDTLPPRPGSFYLTTVDDAVAGIRVEFHTNMEKTSDMSIDGGAIVPSGKSLSDRATTPFKRETDGRTISTGIWIDAVAYPQVDPGNKIPYFDFYIKGCWTPLGSLPDSQTLTIVRIYDQD
ncbi:prepilin-type N-terminal cleavage/methylation domain-containing protein [Candidatus Saccharibacteria bacterium]|nr:prepilin-type N-terminal cleavage/methylation domain-containing protein [Candidatus Saccharibacteria bacterium]